MEINTSVTGAKATLVVVGKLTVQTAPDLSDAINAVPETVCDFEIDLSEVDYVSSAGLRTFVSANKLALRRGGTLVLLHPQDDIMDIFDMTGLIDVLTIEG